jgi:DNA-binding beta-propeller fold protein YncE
MDWRNGDFYVSDGYSNARVHKYDADGRHLLSWGQSGTDAGEFNTVHNVATDKDGWVYVADRENNRVQVFGPDGKFEAQWGNLAAASCLYIERSGDELVYLGEFYAGIPENPGGMGNWTGRRLGPRVSILDKSGNLVTRVGDQPIGEEPGQFIAPHGIAVDSRGDIYVAEVSFSAYGTRQDPPREARTLQKLVRRR